MGSGDDLSADSNKSKVGYGNPPKHSQFKRGQSGNPQGRPKGSQNLATVLERILRKPVIVRENGRSKKITTLEHSVLQLTKKATEGNLRALQQLIALVRSAEAQAPQENHKPTLSETDQKVLQGILQRVQTTNNVIQGDHNDSDRPPIHDR